MVEQREIQEKLFMYQLLEEQLKALSQRRDLFVSRMIEIDSTLNSIEEIEKSKNKEIFLPIGSSVYIPGTVSKNEKMIVGLGADVAIEKSVEKTEEILKERRKVLEDGLKTVEKQVLDTSNEMIKLEPEIRGMLKKIQTGSQKMEK